MTTYRFLYFILVIFSFLCHCFGGDTTAPANDGLLLPVALGFLLKVVLIVLGGMIKLLFLGFTSLGTSGVALLLGILFLKNQGLVVPPSWSPPHHRIDQMLPQWLRQPQHSMYPGYHRQRNAKLLDLSSNLYKANDGKYSERNEEHPVPVISQPHQV